MHREERQGGWIGLYSHCVYRRKCGGRNKMGKKKRIENKRKIRKGKTTC